MSADGGTQQAGIPSSPITIVVAILASFVAFLDGSIVNVALPGIADELGGGVSTQQWVVDGYLLTLGSLILVAGSLGDQWGRARTLRAGLVIFGAASVACAFAPTALLLVIARVVQGIGGALLVPSSLAMITSAFDGTARGKAVGSWTAWTSVAFIVGPPLGGALVDTVGWRWVFAVNVLPVVVTLIVMRRFDDGAVHHPLRIDAIGAALVVLGLAGLVFGLIELPSRGMGDPVALTALILGVLLVIGFVWWERRTKDPLMPADLFASRNFTFGNLATVGIYAGVGLAVLIVTLFLQEVVHVPATLAGAATLPVALLSLFLARWFGGLAATHGPRLFMTAGPLIAAIAFVWMATTTADPADAWLHVLSGMVVYGLGLAITVAPLTSAVLGSVPAERSGVASAFNNAVARIAGLIAVAFAGVIAGGALTDAGFQRLALFTAALFAVGGLTSLVGIRNAERAPVEPHVAAQCSDRTGPIALTRTKAQDG